MSSAQIADWPRKIATTRAACDTRERPNMPTHRAHDPEQSMPQLLEVIEEGHLSIGGRARHLRAPFYDIPRRRSRASAASSDSGKSRMTSLNVRFAVAVLPAFC